MSQYRRDSMNRRPAGPARQPARPQPARTGNPAPRANKPRTAEAQPRPLWFLILAHVVALGVALLLYALPHHVIPRAGKSLGITSSRNGAVTTQAETAAPVVDAAAVTPVPTAEPVVTAEPEPTPPVGNFRAKFADHFSQGVERTANGYRSENLDITLNTIYDEQLASHYHVADIYVADISCLVTAFAQEQYGSSFAEWPQEAASRYHAILTMNGDYYGMRDGGIVIRNGTLYRDEKNLMDLCVLYWDGSMKTFDPFNFNAEAEIANGAYQCWCFGPGLLDAEGHAKTSFNSSVNQENPRAVIGCVEPGHYFFVTVDGRTSTDKGVRMADVASLMERLGCTSAYNLDGGQSAMLVAGTTVVNNPYKGGRKSSDFIMVLDRAEQ